jgi:hypothetical protein
MPPTHKATPRQAIRRQINGVKIARISPHVVNALTRNWEFVKIETDQGITGWGEASLEMQTRCVVGCVEDLSAFILDQDPRRIEHLYQIMYRHGFFCAERDRIESSRSSPGWTCLRWSASDKTARSMWPPQHSAATPMLAKSCESTLAVWPRGARQVTRLLSRELASPRVRAALPPTTPRQP